MSAEKRRTSRKDMHVQGLIVDVDGSIISPCMMVNVSHTGAKLIPKVPADVPDCFVLLLSKHSHVRRQCEVVWRSGKTIGVRFIPMQADDRAHSFVDDALARMAVKS